MSYVTVTPLHGSPRIKSHNEKRDARALQMLLGSKHQATINALRNDKVDDLCDHAGIDPVDAYHVLKSLNESGPASGEAISALLSRLVPAMSWHDDHNNAVIGTLEVGAIDMRSARYFAVRTNESSTRDEGEVWTAQGDTVSNGIGGTLKDWQLKATFEVPSSYWAQPPAPGTLYEFARNTGCFPNTGGLHMACEDQDLGTWFSVVLPQQQRSQAMINSNLNPAVAQGQKHHVARQLQFAPTEQNPVKVAEVTAEAVKLQLPAYITGGTALALRSGSAVDHTCDHVFSMAAGRKMGCVRCLDAGMWVQ